MKRNISQLSSKEYDVLVIGGGIYGACVAWDAALRGISVALIEKDDFGHATSANSLKIIHGGLRYLQDGSMRLVRRMAHERRAFLFIAPHLVHPLRCVMPTYPKLMRSKLVLGAALKVNDLLSFDRNHNLPDPQKHLRQGKIVSRDQFLDEVPGIANQDVNGGAVWHDAQVYNTERFTLSFVLSAVQKGAVVANYIEATDFLRNSHQVVGVRARDSLTGIEFKIRAKVVVVSAGPWAQNLLERLGVSKKIDYFRPSLAINLVTRQILPDYAIGVPNDYSFVGQNGAPRKKSQILFIVPWQGYSLIGTKHYSFDGQIADYRPSKLLIQAFVEEINSAYPGAALTQEDIYLVHSGFLPDESSTGAPNVKLVRESPIIDHGDIDGTRGLITIVGVKYTTARHAAERVVNLVCKKLDMPAPSCQTAVTPIFGGQIEHLDMFITQEMEKQADGLDVEILCHLIANYGSEYLRLLKYTEESDLWAKPLCEGSLVTRAEVIHALREEMALKLSDVILRRTELGSARRPPPAAVQTCARIMAAEHGWDPNRMEQEINELKSYYNARTLN